MKNLNISDYELDSPKYIRISHDVYPIYDSYGNYHVGQTVYCIASGYRNHEIKSNDVLLNWSIMGDNCPTPPLEIVPLKIERLELSEDVFEKINSYKKWFELPTLIFKQVLRIYLNPDDASYPCNPNYYHEIEFKVTDESYISSKFEKIKVKEKIRESNSIFVNYEDALKRFNKEAAIFAKAVKKSIDRTFNKYQAAREKYIESRKLLIGSRAFLMNYIKEHNLDLEYSNIDDWLNVFIPTADI